MTAQKNLAIGKHLLHCGNVRTVDQRELLQLAHASLRLGPREMALAGMRADDFARSGEFETFGRAAMRLQFPFRLARISWHCRNFSSCAYKSYYAFFAGCCELGFATGPSFLGSTSATSTSPSTCAI